MAYEFQGEPEPGELLHHSLESILGLLPVELTDVNSLPIQVVNYLIIQD
jgi:hypothetical protein